MKVVLRILKTYGCDCKFKPDYLQRFRLTVCHVVKIKKMLKQISVVVKSCEGCGRPGSDPLRNHNLETSMETIHQWITAQCNIRKGENCSPIEHTVNSTAEVRYIYLTKVYSN